jgi:hypothetical protein
MWLQGAAWGYPIDLYARPLLNDPKLKLTNLLDRQFFFLKAHRIASYVLAGSFTGHLMRNHGWEKYRELYRTSNVNNFEANFKKCFGVSLEETEAQWRKEVVVTDSLIRSVKKYN